MSLINQMLQDLEKRGEDQSSHAASHYVQFGDFAHLNTKRSRLRWILFILALLAVAVAYWVFKAKPQHTPAAGITVTHGPDIGQVGMPAKIPTASISSADSVLMEVSPTLRDLGLSLKLSTQVDVAHLQNPPENSQAPVSSDKSTKAASEVYEISAASKLAVNSVTDKSGAQAVNQRRQLATEMPPTVGAASALEVKGKGNAAPVSQVVASTASTASAHSALPVTMIKEVSTQQRAEGEYRQATVYQQQGRVNEALSALDSALKLDPLHAPARQLLISLLLENKRHEEAIRELRQGLVIEPIQLNFSMILARLLVERAKLTEAIEVLQKNVGLAQERPDYLAFLAALQQKTGHHKEAISLYRQALRLHAQNGSWWMGLGISLQSEANFQEAIDAFKQAKLQPGLSAELHAFLDQRISQLQK